MRNPRRLAAVLTFVAVGVMSTVAQPGAWAKKPRDRDHDGLSNRFERKRSHTSPRRPDTDRDRLRDGFEVRKSHTNPRRKDTDRDGLTDGYEVKRSRTNPRRKDTDRDGLTDRYEIRRSHTNPRRKDTDGDGIPDGVEIANGTDPTESNGAGVPGAAPPAPAGCPNPTPNVADGPDPWGGCFPGPSNTGAPDASLLAPYVGPCRITTPGTVIEFKIVNCTLDIAASGVVIRNSQVNGSIDSFDATDSVTVEDSTIDAGPVNGSTNSGARAIMDQHFDLLRVEAIRGVSGGWCNDDCVIRDSWFHAQDPDEGGAAHMSAFRQGGGAAARAQQFIHNSFACDAPIIEPDAGCSADITGYGDFETVQNNYFHRNLLVESPEGAFCAYGGSSGSSNGAKPFPFGNNNEWRENIFQHGSNGKCGSFGAITDLDAGVRGNVWDNNRWDTGELVR